MRFPTVCAFAAFMLGAPAGAQVAVPANPEFLTQDEECAIALAAVADRGSLHDFNVWPMLRPDADDTRWPLDCSRLFRAAGLLRPDMFARESLSISRPRFSAPDAATVIIDSSRGLQSHTRTRYTLAREDGEWRVTARAEEPMDGALQKLA